MKRKMNPVQVETDTDGNVLISQFDPLRDEDPVIVLSPDQAPLITSWIREAAGVTVESPGGEIFVCMTRDDTMFLVLGGNADACIPLGVETATRLRDELTAAILVASIVQMQPELATSVVSDV